MTPITGWLELERRVLPLLRTMLDNDPRLELEIDSDLVHGVRRVATAVANHVRRAPGTHIHLLVLLVTTATVRSLDPTLATQLLRRLSTNLKMIASETACRRREHRGASYQ